MPPPLPSNKSATSLFCCYPTVSPGVVVVFSVFSIRFLTYRDLTFETCWWLVDVIDLFILVETHIVTQDWDLRFTGLAGWGLIYGGRASFLLWFDTRGE